MAVWGSCSDYLRKDLELIHLRAARLIHKLPRDMEDETVLINASWMPLKYFYCSRILNITHRAFYNLELGDTNSLVVRTFLLIVLGNRQMLLYLGQELNRVVVHLNTELQLPRTLCLTLSNSSKTLTLLKER